MKITAVKAPAYSIVVEMLRESEINDSKLIFNTTDKESNRAYVVDVGPLVDEKAGVKKGDLVIVQGNYIPLPNPTENNRKWGSVDLHSIKAILTTEGETNDCCRTSRTKNC